MSTTKRGKSLKSDSKSLIYNIIRFCVKETENFDFLIIVANATKRVREIDKVV